MPEVTPRPDTIVNPTNPSRRPVVGRGEQDAPPRISGYEIVRLLGRGGMASVYLARQIKLSRLVALKELSPPLACYPEFAQRFLRESHVAGGLSHPNVVTVFDYFEDGGLPYIAMEFVAGGSLRRHMAGRSPEQVAGALAGMLSGLAHAHDAGVVHRDLKPENVLVAADGTVKLADFGIARAAGRAAGASDGERPTGTPAYMAPEAGSAGAVEELADLWSVGAIAYEMLTGRLPGAPGPSLGRAAPDVPPPLSAWVETLLDAVPRRRPASAAEACERLDEIALTCFGPRWRSASRLAARPTTGSAASPVRTRGAAARGRWLAAAGACLLAVGSGLVALPSRQAPGAAARVVRDASPVSFATARYRPPVRLTAPRTVRARSVGGDPVPVLFRVTGRRGWRRVAARCTPASGSRFPVGTTRVRCRAGDASVWLRVVVAGTQQPRAAASGGADPATPAKPAAPDPRSDGEGVAIS